MSNAFYDIIDIQKFEISSIVRKIWKTGFFLSVENGV